MRSTFFAKLLLFVLMLGFMPQTALAKAVLQVYPTRVTIEDGENSAVISVINGGTKMGRYRVEIVDMVMPEEGGLQKLPEGQTKEYSAKDFLRLSPRSITVPPGQSQKFRILSRMPRDMPEGEYRSHISVLMSSEDVEADQDGTSGEGFGVRLRPHMRVVFPVVVVKGNPTFTAQIQNITRVVQHNVTKLGVEFVTQGDRSATGTLVLTLNKNGQTYEIFRGQHTNIYRGVPRRLFVAPLKMPKDVTLDGGVVTARYMDARDEDKVLAEKTVNM
ncbi:MAG: hypothetical protein MK052_07340 [Alphaproteobacteria bacterium]|nr:hypothetical protein [Alphaproteobacteria bacterium]